MLLRFKDWYSTRQYEYAEYRARTAKQMRLDAEEELERAAAWEAHEAARAQKALDKAKRAAFERRRELRMLELGL